MGCQYEELDPWGFALGFIAFTLALLYCFYLLQKFDLNRSPILCALVLSAIGHFMGAWALFEFAMRIGADSCFYFTNATMKYQGTGYWFAFLILGYAKHYLLEESFLGAFLISGAIGLISSTYLVIAYRILLNRIYAGYQPYYYLDRKQLVYPIMLLFCWPSYFFWSAGIIKDNFAFFAITMALFVIVRGKLTFSSFITLFLASFLGFMVRPYLFIIFAISGFLYTLLASNIKLNYKLTIVGMIWIVFSMLSPLLNNYSSMVHFPDATTLRNIGEYAIRQQGYMAIGSSIPVPTHNPYLMFLFIPWLVSANLLLPLIYGAKNLIGLISSIENLYLLWWIVWYLHNRKYWRQLSQHFQIVKFLMLYFLFGMTCLSIMCTNLGLAMREKMMYVPALLLCMFITFAYKRMLIIEQSMQKKELDWQQS